MKLDSDTMLAPAGSRAAPRTAAAARSGWRRVLTHTHTFSGQPDHGGTVAPPESYRRLAAWAVRQGIDAIGMGSPFTPATARDQHRYDGPDREAYYDGRCDREALLQRGAAEIVRMLAEANRASGSRCLFYLDNETPKGRFGHLWWIGHQPDAPPWHDYDQPFDRWMLTESDPEDDRDEPVPYERRPYAAIVATQRARGALGVWAHPTSWWRDDAGRFVTNIATEMPAHAAADGGIDGLVVMGYQPYRPTYQALWFALLDRGYRVPAMAEMDCGLSDPATWSRDRALLNHLELPELADEEPLTLPRLTTAFRQGRVTLSSGPCLTLRVDGKAMGQTTRTAEGMRHAVEIVASPAEGEARLARIELVGRRGEVLWRRDHFAGGTLRVTLPGTDERGYVVARAFGDATPGVHGHRRFERFAITNPVYLHPRGQSFATPVTTRVQVTPRSESPFTGGTVRFETAAGERLEQGTLGADGAQAVAPASGRVTVLGPGGETITRYLINANEQVRALQRYLYRGRFLRDFPDRPPGDVPVEAWHLDEFPIVMRQLTLEV